MSDAAEHFEKLWAQSETYDGSFDLDRLQPGQFVRSAGDGTGACEVGNDTDGWRRINIGDPLP